MALILITVMDKYFFALIFFANYQFYAYSQKEMVKIEGFLIERYSKKEIFRKDTLSIDHSMRRVNQQVQNYKTCLKNSHFGVEKFNFSLGLSFNFFCIDIILLSV